MIDKQLKELYPSWLYIEPKISKIYLDINKTYSRKVIEDSHSRIFQKYVDKYFKTWDGLACCMNGDMIIKIMIIVAVAACTVAWFNGDDNLSL